MLIFSLSLPSLFFLDRVQIVLVLLIARRIAQPQLHQLHPTRSKFGFRSCRLSSKRVRPRMTEVTDVIKPKEKTKSKVRYLKRKKERRKNKPKVSKKKVEDEHDEDDEDDEDIAAAVPAEPVERHITEKAKRPKKRPRLEDEEELGGEEEHDEKDEDVEMATGDIVQDPLQAHKSPTPEPTLPSFPLPALPNAPSPEVLALQGLDQALISAEWVSPSTTLPIPSGKDDGGTRLSERTRTRLRDIGITELFAVQTALLPFLLPPQESPNELYLPFNPPCDVCVSAPTGSGKTLAYVLPIIETLSSRVVTRLRALIVLPTRDLVSQVRETIEVLSKGTKLKIGTATGQHSFAHEQSQLVQDRNIDLHGGSSKVDILICTPGRLIDHLVGTPNFSLQHLRFLVVDEADRLLAQSFQDWLAQVLAATRSSHITPTITHSIPHEKGDAFIAKSYPLDSFLPDGLSPTMLDKFSPSNVPTFFMEHKSTSCQKLLFSATLTRDPGKISALELKNPKYFIVQGSEKNHPDSNLMDVVTEKFSMPATLSEHMVILDPTQKPLVFFHLVLTYDVKNALVFTKSAESTIRLVRLFDFFEAQRTQKQELSPLIVRAYSSDLPAQERKSILEQFKTQKINILVCSDLISRGIDISHVSHVISYDVPVDMRKYVHRVGRTARAGRTGDAWTLVEQQEARYFKQMLKEAGHLEMVKRVRVNDKDLEGFMPHYEVALNSLKEVYTRQS